MPIWVHVGFSRMFSNMVCVLMFTSGILSFLQNDYDLKFERLEINSYDGKLVTYAKTHNFKYNRTNAVVNWTVNIAENLGNHVNIEVQAYKMASNEYRLFPLRFMFNFCHAVAENDFGLGGFLSCGNFSGCPIRKAKVFVCNWAPDGHRFPPHIPNGMYKLDLKFFVGEKMVLFVELYLTITRPLV